MKKWAGLGLMLALAACASDGDKAVEKPKDEPKVKQNRLKTEDLICPQVAILTEAQEHYDYGGEKPAPAQLVSAARMKSVEGDCGYGKDGIDIAFKLHMVAARGARLGGDSVSFPYFIAVVDPNDNVLSRQVVTAKFRFSGNDRNADADEALHVVIPLPEAAQQAGPDYRVLTGFIGGR